MTQSLIDKAGPRLLYFSPVFLQSYPQRPHYFVRHFLSKPRARVLWVNPYISRLVTLSDVRQSMKLHNQKNAPPEGIEVQTPFALPIEPLPGGTLLNQGLFWSGLRKAWKRFACDGPLTIGIGKPSRLAITALRTLPHEASFFDAMDNFPAFHQGLSRRSMEKSEQYVVSLVDEVCASSSYLFERMSALHPHVTRVLNAYDMRKLPACTDPLGAVQGSGSVKEKPGSEGDGTRLSEGIGGSEEDGFSHAEGIGGSKDGKICFGYVGSIATWFDWDAVLRLAEAFPGRPIHLVGPLFVKPPSQLPGQVRLHGPCSHEEALAHAQKFTIGLIPFKQSLLTAGVDPIKYYEYRGLGLPVLSTRFGEMALRKGEEGVFFLDAHVPVEKVVEQALAWRPVDVARFREANDWKHRLTEAGIFEKS